MFKSTEEEKEEEEVMNKDAEPNGRAPAAVPLRPARRAPKAAAERQTQRTI